MLSAQIKNTEVAHSSSNIVSVIATVQGIASMSSADEMLVALSAASGHRMSTIAGSVVMMEERGANEAIFRAMMAPAHEVLPATAAGNMTALSSNMFMDANEKLWALRSSGDQQMLVRSVSEDPAELADMMQSCSSDIAVEIGRDPILRKACANFAASLSAAEGSDIVSFVRDDKQVDVGFIAYVSKSADGQEALAIQSMDGEVFSVSREAVIAVMPSTNVHYPDVHLSESAAANSSKTLLDYYRRVFGHAPEYFKKLSEIIKGHAFA